MASAQEYAPRITRILATTVRKKAAVAALPIDGAGALVVRGMVLFNATTAEFAGELAAILLVRCLCFGVLGMMLMS